jgi:hypothetical protein
VVFVNPIAQIRPDRPIYLQIRGFFSSTGANFSFERPFAHGIVQFRGDCMPPRTPQPRRKRSKLPFLVALVALYQVAKAGFFSWVFLQCWQARGGQFPPFGDVRNPLFESPYFLVFPALALFCVVLALGLLALQNWARAASALLLIVTVPWWLLETSGGHASMLFPVEPSTMLAAFGAEAVAVGILYITQEAKEAFSPSDLKPLD